LSKLSKTSVSFTPTYPQNRCSEPLHCALTTIDHKHLYMRHKNAWYFGAAR